MGKTPLVLDFDASAGALPGAAVLALAHWHQRIRFGCSLRCLAALQNELVVRMPADPGPVFTGSGDFHHVSLLLLQRITDHGPLDVVVLDNHPDNMRYPWGIHCGSWVSHVARLPFVRQVQVMGISASDVSLRHVLENRLLPLWRGRVSYWCLGLDVRWASYAGLGAAIRGFDSSRAMLDAFTEQQKNARAPIYLSVDKDVLSPEVARTNWDQGRLTEADILEVAACVRPRLAGCDITGDVSVAHYASRWKRWLSRLDAQPEVDGAELGQWQAAQHSLNRRILHALAPCQPAVNEEELHSSKDEK